jgi:hypothetical protein
LECSLLKDDDYVDDTKDSDEELGEEEIDPVDNDTGLADEEVEEKTQKETLSSGQEVSSSLWDIKQTSHRMHLTFEC